MVMCLLRQAASMGEKDMVGDVKRQGGYRAVAIMPRFAPVKDISFKLVAVCI